MKVYNDKNVFDAAMERIEFAFDKFDNLCVSYSGGKDSTAMLLHMIELQEQIDEVMFCDTFKEFPAMYKHIE